MRTACLVFAAAMLAALPALARTALGPADDAWYILDFVRGECVSATSLVPAYPTPDLYNRNLLAQHRADSMRVGKDDQGKVHYVAVAGRPATDRSLVTTFWFPTRALCGEGRSAAVAAGVIHDELVR